MWSFLESCVWWLTSANKLDVEWRRHCNPLYDINFVGATQNFLERSFRDVSLTAPPSSRSGVLFDCSVISNLRPTKESELFGPLGDKGCESLIFVPAYQTDLLNGPLVGKGCESLILKAVCGGDRMRKRKTRGYHISQKPRSSWKSCLRSIRVHFTFGRRRSLESSAVAASSQISVPFNFKLREAKRL